MTSRQTAKYFAEFGRLRAVYRARGLDSTAIEARRHALIHRALGGPKSSKTFTNSELDRVLAAIRAELAPADFAAQLALQEQPERRISILQSRLHVLSQHLGIEPGHEAAYVLGMARRMFGAATIAELGERNLQQLEGALRRAVARRHDAPRLREIDRAATTHATRILAVIEPALAANARATGAVHSSSRFANAEGCPSR